MFDTNSTYWLIGLGFLTSFLSTLLINSVGRILAVIFFLPTAIFLISFVFSGLQVHSIADLNPWITNGITDGLIPVIITGIGEAFGTPCGRGLRKLLKW